MLANAVANVTNIEGDRLLLMLAKSLVKLRDYAGMDRTASESAYAIQPAGQVALEALDTLFDIAKGIVAFERPHHRLIPRSIADAHLYFQYRTSQQYASSRGADNVNAFCRLRWTSIASRWRKSVAQAGMKESVVIGVGRHQFNDILFIQLINCSCSL